MRPVILEIISGEDIMIGLILIVGGGLLLGLYVWAGIWAWRAAQRSSAMPGPRARAMRLIALHLAEPLINTVLVGLLLLVVNRNLEQVLAGSMFLGGPSLPLSELVAELAKSTWPMLILALPVIGLGLADPDARRVCRGLLVLGALRWAVTAFVLSMPLALPLGMALLWYCTWWSRRQVRALQNVSYQAIGLGDQGVMVDYAENMRSGGARVNR